MTDKHVLDAANYLLREDIYLSRYDKPTTDAWTTAMVRRGVVKSASAQAEVEQHGQPEQDMKPEDV